VNAIIDTIKEVALAALSNNPHRPLIVISESDFDQ